MNDHDTPLIPRRILFSNPDRSVVTISPDGSQLMWLASQEGVLNVWIAPRENPDAARVITQDRDQGIRSCFWSYNKGAVLSLQDTNGDENWHLHAIDPGTGTSRDLTPFEGVKAEIYPLRPARPDEVIVGLNRRDPRWHDIYRINLVTGECTLEIENNHFAGVITDNDLKVRLAEALVDDGSRVIHRLDNGEWQPWQTIPADDMFTTSLIGFDQCNQTVYMRDSRGRDTAALVAINLANNETTVLAADDAVDVGDVLFHPGTRNLQAASFFNERRRWRVLDDALGEDFKFLNDPERGDLGINARSLDDRYWIIYYAADDAPVAYFLYDRQQRNAEFLFTQRKALEAYALAKMRPTQVTARDGLKLLAYYSLPHGTDRQLPGIPDTPLPLVLVPHGGPWNRDYWSCHPWHQWLTNRGYAVLSVNFRGSIGFGKAHVNAGDCEWGGKIIEDQRDAVQWAVESGIADPQRLAVFGISFGGYSALAGLTFTPDLFACGVDLVGPANLVTLMQTLPAYWAPLRSQFNRRVGNPDTKDGRALLEKHSPINYIDRLCKPLLVGQGANDPRVKQAESDRIVEAAQAKGFPVTYALYPDEGHVFVRPQNNMSFYAMAEVFLAEHLGGRCESFDGDFENSSVTMMAGVQHIPGLKEALVG